MALPKKIKDRVAIIALQDAADGDFGSEDSMEKDEKPLKHLSCPKCGYEGSEEEFQETEE